MMTDAERYAVIAEIKRGAEFVLRGDDLSAVGRLRAITTRDLDDSALIETMAEARTRNGRYFMSRFDVSPQNKRAWLADKVIGEPKRVLFFVMTVSGEIVGQDGFTYLGGGRFELDGTMRWASGGPRGLYVRSGVERAGICFSLLDCDTSFTEVFADNPANVKNSLRMGHEITAERPLFLSERCGMMRYEKIDCAERANTDRTMLEFTMTKRRFAELHPMIVAHPQTEVNGYTQIDRMLLIKVNNMTGGTSLS